MSATELQFRTAAIGGFQKQDVMSYIESANQAHQEKLDQLQRERDQLEREKQELSAQLEQANAQAAELSAAQQALSDQLEQAGRETSRLQAELERRDAQLEQANAQLAEAKTRLAQAEPDAAAYRQVKDRTAGIELEAHCRAQEVRQEAEEKIRRAHTEVEQWLHKVNAGYDLLRSDMGGAITRTGQELDRLRQLLEQLSAHFDTQDEHLRKLSQDCVSDFTPPTPLPLEEQ